jgi:8-oxo-dGTP pyrophosphatase MutT (NUDIX family)
LAPLRNARATSAGGVVYRVRDDLTEVVLVHRRTPPLWALPKGTPSRGESLEETALRETREETGLEVEIAGSLGSIRYFFVRNRTRFHKTVHFYLMRAVGGDVGDHDHEFDEVRWFQIEEALAIATYPTEREVMQRAAALIAGQGHHAADGHSTDGRSAAAASA